MAREADLAPSTRRMATRIWYVVNRRLLVDAAWEHGVHLAELLADPTGMSGSDGAASEALVAVAEALRQRGGAGLGPLHVSRLRGNAELGARPPDPSQPAIVFATVPMYASRWLFRGYGTSNTMRSVDAGLAGTDSLVLLDEAHLSRALLNLTEPLARCDVGDPSTVLPVHRARPTVVSLTATGGVSHPFTLDAADEQHPIIRRRLAAKKPIRPVTCPKNQLAQRVANEVLALLGGEQSKSAVVFANAPATARAIYEALRRGGAGRTEPSGIDVMLLTGRIREREAEGVRRRLTDPELGAPAGRDRDRPRSRDLVVVATQTLEVGADLDFDVLVTEACGARALVQRLGRLNRLGDVDDAAGAVVLAEGERTFGIYGDEPLAVWNRLMDAAVDGVVDLGPARAGEIVGQPADSAPRAGELLPAHVWEWAKTTTAPPGEAPPEPFYDGIVEPDATVSVVWRVLVPADGSELRPAVSAAESIDLPLWEARDAFQALSMHEMTRLRQDRVTVERVAPGRLRPGDVVVLSVSAGCYDEFGWAPGAATRILDLSLLRPPGVPLVEQAIDQLGADGDHLDAAKALTTLLAEQPDLDDDVDAEALAHELLDELRAAGPGPLLKPEEWSSLSERMQPSVVYAVDEPVGRLVVIPAPHVAAQAELRSDSFDELCFTATSADLAQHLGSVGELASRIATDLGVPSQLVEAVRVAGRFHDLGKADGRFQAWLDPFGAAPAPVAKSARRRQDWERDRIAAGWPRGGRHEELSRRLVSAYLQDHPVDWDIDLVLHLVVTHHGYGRPLVPGARGATWTTVETAVDGVDVRASADLQDVDWGQPARFRRCCEHYGYWGLALLEAIVRQADHEASRVVVA
jgi:CRISPR-associated endonuclease/helicase Cas3